MSERQAEKMEDSQMLRCLKMSEESESELAGKRGSTSRDTAREDKAESEEGWRYGRSWRRDVSGFGQQKHSMVLSRVSSHLLPRAVELTSYELRNPHFPGLLESFNACMFLIMETFMETRVPEGTTCYCSLLTKAPVHCGQTIRT